MKNINLISMLIILFSLVMVESSLAGPTFHFPEKNPRIKIVGYNFITSQLGNDFRLEDSSGKVRLQIIDREFSADPKAPIAHKVKYFNANDDVIELDPLDNKSFRNHSHDTSVATSKVAHKIS